MLSCSAARASAAVFAPVPPCAIDSAVVNPDRLVMSLLAPFFASESELKDWPREEGSLSWFLMPRLKVSKENLFEALEQVEALVDWLDSKIYAP